MAFPKPIIANPVFEVSSLVGQGLAQGDGTTVTNWPDQSGEGNNMPLGDLTPHYEVDGWDVGIPSVRCQAGEYFDYTGGADLNNTDLTVFIVVQVIDISLNNALIGSASSSSFPRRVTCAIGSDGTAFFNFSENPPNIASAAGLVSDGDKLIVVCRFSQTTGMLLRVNQADAGASPSQTTSQIDIGLAVLGRSQDSPTGFGNFTGDKRYGWASAYHSAASDQEILEMECFLATEFGFPLAPVGTVWTPEGTQIPVATPWVPEPTVV